MLAAKLTSHRSLAAGLQYVTLIRHPIGGTKTLTLTLTPAPTLTLTLTLALTLTLTLT